MVGAMQPAELRGRDAERAALFAALDATVGGLHAYNYGNIALSISSSAPAAIRTRSLWCKASGTARRSASARC